MGSLANRKDNVLFLSFVGPNYSRSSTILNAKSEKFQKQFQKVPTGILRAFLDIYNQRKAMRLASCIVIMSPCHILTPAVKILVRRPVILDSGWALTDGQLSRGFSSASLLRVPTIYLVDFLAFHFANLILMESKAQIKRSSRKFMIKQSKMKVSFTGLNETTFRTENNNSELIKKVNNKLSKLGNGLTVLFRGKVNNESGFEYICEAARRLENKVSFIFLIGQNDVQREFPANVISISGISDSEMCQIYNMSDIALGQISSHPRLRYTIPHKAFEAGFFATPYISADNAGIREFLDSGDAIFISEPFTEGLVDAILSLSEPTVREEIAGRISEKYKKSAAQSIVNEKFENLLFSLVSTN